MYIMAAQHRVYELSSIHRLTAYRSNVSIKLYFFQPHPRHMFRIFVVVIVVVVTTSLANTLNTDCKLLVHLH